MLPPIGWTLLAQQVEDAYSERVELPEETLRRLDETASLDFFEIRGWLQSPSRALADLPHDLIRFADRQLMPAVIGCYLRAACKPVVEHADELYVDTLLETLDPSDGRSHRVLYNLGLLRLRQLIPIASMLSARAAVEDEFTEAAIRALSGFWGEIANVYPI